MQFEISWLERSLKRVLLYNFYSNDLQVLLVLLVFVPVHKAVCTPEITFLYEGNFCS